MRGAACAFAVVVIVLAGRLNAGPVNVVTSRDAFEAAVGAGAVEDFTISEGTAAILTGPLNASSSYPALFHFGSVRPGDIIEGVTFSNPGATEPITGEYSATFVVDHGGVAQFNESFLATYTRERPGPQPILIDFDRPVLGFGFVTDHVYTGDAFNVSVRYSDGAESTQTLANPRADGDNGFYGFVSDDADIVGASFLGTSVERGPSFAMDDFTLVVPLPPALYISPVAALCVAAAVRVHRRCSR